MTDIVKRNKNEKQIGRAQETLHWKMTWSTV